MHSIRFSAMKIHRNAVKIIVFDDNIEISTVKIELLLACTDNIVLTYKYHVCVLLFITFHLICNMSIFRDTWKLTNFSKIQIQILKKAHLGFLGSFDMLFLVLQANYCEKNQLDGNFCLSQP